MYIAIEGVIGVGKTTLARFVIPLLPPTCSWKSLRKPLRQTIFTATEAATPFRPKSSSAQPLPTAAPRHHGYLAAGRMIISDYT